MPCTRDTVRSRAETKATRMVRRQVLCVALVATMAVASAQPAAVSTIADDRIISAGRWAVVSVEWNGRHVDPEFLSMLQVVFRSDGTWSVLFKRIPAAEGRSTNQQDKTPKKFDMETLGSEGIKPKHYAGIYRIDGDTRVLCIAPDGEPRPEEFSAPRLSGRMLVTLKRAPKL